MDDDRRHYQEGNNGPHQSNQVEVRIVRVDVGDIGKGDRILMLQLSARQNGDKDGTNASGTEVTSKQSLAPCLDGGYQWGR